MGRREQTKEARRRVIVQAARYLIQHTGKAGFTMQELADHADVSLMTPYNLFGSKQAIMMAVLDADLSVFEEKLARARGDELDMLFKTISVARSLYESDEAFYRTVFTGIYNGATGEFRSTFRDPRRQLWTRLVDDAIRAGYLEPAAAPSLVAANIGYLFYSCVMDWLAGDFDLAEFELRTQFAIALTLLGIVSPASEQRVRKRLDATGKRLARIDNAKRRNERAQPEAVRTLVSGG